MATRADFYVGTGPDAEWLGSVAFDGYKWNKQGAACALMSATNESEFCVAAVAKLDRHGKQVVCEYLAEELTNQKRRIEPRPTEPVTYQEGGEQ